MLYLNGLICTKTKVSNCFGFKRGCVLDYFLVGQRKFLGVSPDNFTVTRDCRKVLQLTKKQSHIPPLVFFIFYVPFLSIYCFLLFIASSTELHLISLYMYNNNKRIIFYENTCNFHTSVFVSFEF